jgi:hypothetical protein
VISVNSQDNPGDTIAVFMFPLPSPTNYVLLANLVTILSHVYSRVIVITGGIIKNLSHILDDLRLANKKNIYIYDIGSKLPSRSGKASFFIKLVIYIKIQISLIVGAIKLRRLFKTSLLFIGIPHLLSIVILLRLLNKVIVIY